MKIPVFISCPSVLNDRQKACRQLIDAELERFGLEARAIGKSDYPTDVPLREVLVLARHCAGGVILGFEQFQATAGTWKRGTDKAAVAGKPVSFSSPWNNLEAGILFGLGLPLLIFRESEDISGGIFDEGTSEAFVQLMLPADSPAEARQALTDVFLKWQARVRARYYGEISIRSF